MLKIRTHILNVVQPASAQSTVDLVRSRLRLPSLRNELHLTLCLVPFPRSPGTQDHVSWRCGEPVIPQRGHDECWYLEFRMFPVARTALAEELPVELP